jgi:hypothetical protein
MWRILIERRVADVTQRLDPSELDGILERIRRLAENAKKQLPPDGHSLAPGIEAIAWLATQLMSAQHIERVRGDYRERHKAALRELTETTTEGDQALRVGSIIEDGAQIGWHQDFDAKKRPRGPREWFMTEAEADAAALPWIKTLLWKSFPGARAADESILAALKTYRLPVAQKGRPRKGLESATTEQRMAALGPLLEALGVTAGEPSSAARRQRRAKRKK